MNNLILFLLVPTCSGFCEAYWISNISSAYASSVNLSEPGNAISSLTYTVFGLIGLILKNYSNMYYLLMNLFILMGLSSFLHHYYYYNADWAYSADIIVMKTLGSFSLLYIICDNEYYKFKIINKLFNLVIITCWLLMLINYEWRSVFKIIVIVIISTQSLVCVYFLIIKSEIKYIILITSIWNGILFSFGYGMWVIDSNCPEWVWYNRFNGHAIWHICVGWALFNALNISNACRYNFNKINFEWKPLFKRFPWFLQIIIVSNKRSNISDNYTNINLEEIKLLSDGKYHRRVRTFG